MRHREKIVRCRLDSRLRLSASSWKEVVGHWQMDYRNQIGRPLLGCTVCAGEIVACLCIEDATCELRSNASSFSQKKNSDFSPFDLLNTKMLSREDEKAI